MILSVGYFPDIWNQGLITPIFKNGDKFDPNNYRGICVSSNLGKLFCSIINARLLDFITTHNVLSRSQIGFLPNYRTSDHIYTLHTLSTLTRYRLSRHKLMIETGRHRQTWLPPEQRLCSHCDLNQMETELHFLTECSKYTDIRQCSTTKLQQIHPTFKTLPTRRN